MLQYLALSFLASLVFSWLVLWAIIPRLKKMGMVGHDVNKPDRPEVAEMGGIGIMAGMALGILISIFFNTFLGFQFNLDFVLAALVSVFIIALIGFADDLLDIPQAVKAFLPLLAAVPLIALKAAGSTAMYIPFIGPVDMGMLYLFVAIPVGIAVASNLTNMLAGFNGLEAGMGVVALIAASLAAYFLGSSDSLVVYVPLAGALLGFLAFNRYPAKIFPGDVGTLLIGATLAAGAIIGNFETFAALLLLPYVVDFFIKAANRFPSSKW
ncbi:MAG: UDP-N-acetylglucosamine--dolichyl-phosphate N-acetylglucosaminephosphotransferase, partial [Candidatus ainarchaeum sp.]|nr:UDP-N-acetylglucosamine--dolichyl-phosphate N-acetylglucosaminephosphotransferase [Candidatus ainarchaeum sp.]